MSRDEPADNEIAAVERLPTGCRRWVLGGAGWLLAAILLIAAGLWLVHGVQRAREAARRSVCEGRLNRIQMALFYYHDAYGRLPPAYIADAEGRPMHSWRVLLLPYLDEQKVYEEYDFSEPWNGPHNRRLEHRTNRVIFHCPSGPYREDSVVTDFVAVTGPGTAFPGTAALSFEDITDGPENTILFVEIAKSDIHWMEPRDLDVRDMSFVVNDAQRPGISAAHPAGPGVVFADGITVYRLSKSLSPETLRGLTTIAGGEPVRKESLVRRSDQFGRQLGE
jgi:hypothetical protein